MEFSAGFTKPPDHSFSRAVASYRPQTALRNSALAASVAAGSGSTSTVPKSLGSTTRVWVSVSPFTVTFTACPPEDAL